MNQREHPARKPSPGLGLLAVPRAFYRGGGSGATSLRVVTVCVFVLLALLASATSALATPPKFSTFPGGEGVIEEIHPTRARLEIPISAESSETKWRSAYATEKEGSYTPSGSGTLNPGGLSPAAIGSEEPWYTAEVHILRHLTPEKTYFVRFEAENADNPGKPVLQLVEFTTPSVAKPEIVQSLGRTVAERRFSSFKTGSVTAISIEAKADVETNGAPTTYSFAYSTDKSGGWTAFSGGGSGSISVAEDIGQLSAEATGLKPETPYYLRLQATNSKGIVEEVISVKTGTERPIISETVVSNVRGSSARLYGNVTPDGLGSTWRFEYAPSVLGPWSAVPGASGTISAAEAEALPNRGDVQVSGLLAGLSPATSYYVRLAAENEAGESLTCSTEPCEPSSGVTNRFVVTGFETEGHPSVSTFAVHALHGEALRVLGSVNPNESPTSAVQSIAIDGASTGGTFTLTLQGETTEPIPFDASATQIQAALARLPHVGALPTSGPGGGPYHIQFAGSLGGVAQPLIVGDGSGLTPAGSGSVVVSMVEQGGESYDTRYHFEYEGQKQFEEGGGSQSFAHASSTPEVDLGGGGRPVVVGEDLPGLVAGESYRYRLVATSSFPGAPAVDGETQSLTVPSPVLEAQPACGNEVFRTGLSASLPDCRAYEQVTPVDKEGAKELVNYGGSTGEGILAGVDGDHVLVGEPETDWGAGPSAGISPYVFSREAGKGWVLTAATVQPEAGISKYIPEVFSPDLTELGLAAEWLTSAGSKSADFEYKVGPAGGPYAVLPPVPRAEVGAGMVAASEDFSKLILQVEDHTLLAPTHTKSGADLYEYSAGALRQVNIATDGTAIGTCGARIVKGIESPGTVSSSHAVSADGSRVFFEAVPGSKCEEPSNLYVRVDGQSTVDVGAYQFLAASASGGEVLVENSSGDVSRYDSETSSIEPLIYDGGSALSVAAVAVPVSLTVSEDLSAITFTAGKLDAEAPPTDSATTDLYRYDTQAQTLRFIAQVPLASDGLSGVSQSPDGRDLYFESTEVAGVPAGGETPPPKAGLGSVFNQQAFRYDAVEGVLQCVSCASPFDPAPKLNANYLTEGAMRTSIQGASSPRIASANGDYVFFQTPAALLPSDVDGEVEPEGHAPDSTQEAAGAVSPEHESYTTSVSSDVYEWTKDGIHGCARLEGCLSLITSGRGGFHNLLLGTDASGEDVFFYTNESLLSRDNDTAGDIYDARVNGGFPEPVQGVECEGDACSTPPSAPNDATPSSSTLNGTGNLTPPATAVKPGVAKKSVKCEKPRKLSHGKCVKPKKKKKRRAKKSANRSSNNRRGK
jgi:hypothetical protein